MGLLDKFRGTQPNKQATDDILLLHSFLCMAGADGVIEDAEDEMIRNFANVLPEFREMDGDEWCKALTQAKKIWIRYDQNVKTSLQALNEIKSETIRKKAFVLAVDMAMSSGEIDDEEEEMLGEMQRILQIDDRLAQNIVEVVALKYAT
jgi:tellurite resistance protein